MNAVEALGIARKDHSVAAGVGGVWFRWNSGHSGWQRWLSWKRQWNGNGVITSGNFVARLIVDERGSAIEWSVKPITSIEAGR